MAHFPTVFPIRCCRKTFRHCGGRRGERGRISASPGTATSTAASCSTRPGAFIEGYYIVGLLAEALLKKEPGAKIIHDPRLTWNTIDTVTQAGGIPVQSKTGHAFIKERMRAENAVYGGEMSAHHYFRDFAYCDNGNIPWLLVAALCRRAACRCRSCWPSGRRSFRLPGEINRKFPASRRCWRRSNNVTHPMRRPSRRSMAFPSSFRNGRFNLRGSNTEAVLRLNVESRADTLLMQSKTQELLETDRWLTIHSR